MKSTANLFGVVGAALAVIALALPFTGGADPLRVSMADTFLLWQALAGSALLAIPIAGWQLRRLRSSPPWRFEIALAYVLSLAAMAPALYWSAWGAMEAWGRPEEPIFCAGLLASWGLFACNGILLVRNIRHDVVPHVTAEVFLLGGYLPNALFALLLFYPFYGRTGGPNLRQWFFFFGWDIGAYVVLAACIAFVVRIVMLLNSPESYLRPPGAEADSPQAARP